ncbi:MAG: DUF1326 domain-containing protein [Burkholderiales bacterium]
MPYHLEASLVELCTCRVLCPCWIGEDPDYGTCDKVVAWRIDRGEIDGLDVGGLAVAMVARVPGNALRGNWKAVLFLDERASEDQAHALHEVFTGKRGGTLAQHARLVTDIVAVQSAAIAFEARCGEGRVKVGDVAHAEFEPFRNASGAATRLADTVFSTIPGAPAFVGRALRYRCLEPRLGIDLDLRGHSAYHTTCDYRS